MEGIMVAVAYYDPDASELRIVFQGALRTAIPQQVVDDLGRHLASSSSLDLRLIGQAIQLGRRNGEDCYEHIYVDYGGEG
jgi:hypothetical protein